MMDKTDIDVLFTPLQVGELSIKNRIVMAPMTRSRTPSGVPGAMNATYYAQRAGAGLIVTEATAISATAAGAPWVPGIYTHAQVQGWQEVSRAVHAKGAKIFMQLWHAGRVSHPDLAEGIEPVAPSAINADVKVYTPYGFKPSVTPRALSTNEIYDIVAQYAQAATLAMDAGMDGVELHAAFGYLPNQFLSDVANQRNDEYGGSIQNRCRFVVEVLKAMIEQVGPGKVAVRLAPSNIYNNCLDTRPTLLYDALIGMLNDLPLAYVSVMEPFVDMPPQPDFLMDVTTFFRQRYHGLLMTNVRFTPEKARKYLLENKADMIAFGTAFISNPDLPYRMAHHLPLCDADRSTFYGGGAEGYIDYACIEPAINTNLSA